MANKVIVEIDVETGGSEKKIKEAKGDVQDLQKEAKGTGKAFGALGGAADRATGGIISGAKNAVTAVRGLAGGFNILKLAIAATGIGALVIAVVSVIAAVSKLQGVMDKFKQFTAGLGAVMDILGDTIAYIGEALINAFTNPQEALQAVVDGAKGVWEWLQKLNTVIIGSIIGTFLSLKESLLEAAISLAEFFGSDATELKKSLDETKDKIAEVDKAVEEASEGIKQPFIDAAEAVSEYAGELRDAAFAAADLQKAEQELEDARIGQTVTQAKRNKLIAEARLIAEDETKSYAQREEALKRAIELEQLNLQEKKANAIEEARIVTERNALSESTRDDLRAEAEAKARVFELEEQSLKQEKRIFTELQSLRKEQSAKATKQAADEAKKRAELLALIEEEVEDPDIDAALDFQSKVLNEEVRRFGEAQQEKKRLAEELTTFLDAEEDKRTKLQQEEDAKRLASEQSVNAAKRNLAQVAFGAIQEIAEMASGADEGRARKAFALSKSLSLAQATISTYQAVNAVLADKTLPTPAKPFAIASAITTGLLNVAKISRTKFSGGSASPSGGGGGFSIANQAGQTPVLNTASLEQTPQQNIQAYVVDKNLTTAQSQTQKIEEQASLVL